jgi:hypothetical protein
LLDVTSVSSRLSTLPKAPGGTARGTQETFAVQESHTKPGLPCWPMAGGPPPRLPRRWRAPKQPFLVRPDVAARATVQRVLTMLSTEVRAVAQASGHRDAAHLDRMEESRDLTS